VEIQKLARVIEHAKEEHVGGWTFWSGTLDGYPVVISKTLKGMENAAAATAIAAEGWRGDTHDVEASSLSLTFA